MANENENVAAKPKKKMSKKKKIIIGSVAGVLAVILVAVIVVYCVLFITRTGTPGTEVWYEDQVFDITKDVYTMQQKKNADGTLKPFVITQLTDIQLWSNGKDNEHALWVAEQAIRQADPKPDLVVLSGDNVSGGFIPWIIDDVIDLMENLAKEFNFLWAPVFGNHDNEINVTADWSGDKYLEVSVDNGGHCLFRKGPINLGDYFGPVNGNYVINVENPDTHEIIESIYMMDNSTYGGIDDEHGSYSDKNHEDWHRTNNERPITYAQTAWYKWNAENINRINQERGFGLGDKKNVPSMVFTHFSSWEMGIATDMYFGKDAPTVGENATNINPNKDEKDEAYGIRQIDKKDALAPDGFYGNIAGADGTIFTADDLVDRGSLKYFVGAERTVTAKDGKTWTVKGVPVFPNTEKYPADGDSDQPTLIASSEEGMSYGGFKSRPGSPLFRTNFIEEATELGLNAWLFGHDHENDGVIELNDRIIFGYGLKVGPSPEPWNGADYFGGTNIIIEDGNTWKTPKYDIKHIVVEKSSEWWDIR